MTCDDVIIIFSASSRIPLNLKLFLPKIICGKVRGDGVHQSFTLTSSIAKPPPFEFPSMKIIDLESKEGRGTKAGLQNVSEESP